MPQRVDAACSSRAPVVPVLSIDRVEDAVPLARALVDGGLPVLEVTLRTPVALEAIARDPREGARSHRRRRHGAARATIWSAVEAAGARFAISPGATDALYAAAGDAPIPLHARASPRRAN